MITYVESGTDYLSDTFLFGRSSGGWRENIYQAIVFPTASTGIFRNKAIKRAFCHFPEFKKCLLSDLRGRKRLDTGMVIYGSSRIHETWSRITMAGIVVKQNPDDCTQYEYIEQGLRAVRRDYNTRHSTDMKILLPLDMFAEGLDLEILRKIIDEVFADYGRELVVVLP